MIDTLVLVGNEIVKFTVQNGLTAAVGLVTGGALTKYLKRNVVGNVDFRIGEESTKVILRPAHAAGQFVVNVTREFKLKLRDQSKKGTYQLRAELKGNNVSGKWLPGCQIRLNDTEALKLDYEEEGAIIKAAPCRVTSRDILAITLNSTETITRGRGFYALVIGNPKERTTIQWAQDGFPEKKTPKIKACASSEDFDLIIMKAGAPVSVHESSHPVTYFFTWAEELIQ